METLTTTNWVTICATAVLVAGWFINGTIQRRHEVAKERFKFRLEMLKESLELLSELKTKDSREYVTYFSSMGFQTMFKRVDKLFFLYGNKQESEVWNTISHSVRNNTFLHIQLSIYVDQMIELLRQNVRRQLRLTDD